MTGGNIDLRRCGGCSYTVISLMLTNPNTLGLFEEHLEGLSELVHGCGG